MSDDRCQSQKEFEKFAKNQDKKQDIGYRRNPSSVVDSLGISISYYKTLSEL